jgi:SAM-dependent methyltransferase
MASNAVIIKRIYRSIYSIFLAFGFDPRKFIRAVRGIPSYIRDLFVLAAHSSPEKKDFPFGIPYPCLDDRYSESGTASGHYFHQDLLIARRVHHHMPERHVDIGSRIDGFIAHVAAFRPVYVIDIRPLSIKVPNITFVQADIMSEIDEGLKNYCDSLSCLHALEHFGLGRYGDPVQFNGHLFGLQNMHKILKKGGKLYISVPIGPQRIEFNAHRVFSLGYLINLFDGRYKIDEFSYVDDRGDLHENVDLEEGSITSNYNCIYGCGIFELTKL